jgi:hypothetical protein
VKRISAILAFVLVFVLQGSIPAQADSTYSQVPAKDKVNAGGVMTPSFDIQELQLDIGPDGKYNFYFTSKTPIIPSQIVNPAKFVVKVDTNLDKKVDYTISTEGTVIPDEGAVEVSLVNEYQNKPVGCESYAWVVDGYLGINGTDNCFGKLQSYMNVQFSVTGENGNVDQAPEGSTFFKLKTSFWAGQVCNSSKKLSQVTFKDVTFVCIATAGKYSFQPYAKYAASISKLPTEKAFYGCSLSGRYGVELADGGKTLTLDSVYKYGINTNEFACVQGYIGMPTSVKNHIGMTRALDGIQRDSWSRMSALWNYHPDSGMSITLTYK